MNSVVVKDLKVCRGKKTILEDLSFSVKEGELIALIGHNGAGKSTLIKTILGLLKPQAGSVEVLGCAAGTQPSLVGYLPENVSFYPTLTIWENLCYFAQLKAVPLQKVQELVEVLGLTDVAKQKSSKCSKGQKQRLGLAQALLTEPKLLLMDEPTVGLDPMTSNFMYRKLSELKETGCTTIVCTHELQLVEPFTDRALIVDHGHLRAFGTIEELKQRVKAGKVETPLSLLDIYKALLSTNSGEAE